MICIDLRKLDDYETWWTRGELCMTSQAGYCCSHSTATQNDPGFLPFRYLRIEVYISFK